VIFYDDYVFLGKVIGEEEKAQELADYCKNTLDDAIEKARNIRAENRVKVYYAEGPEGLQTEPKESVHTELISLVGGENVAMVSQGSDYGRSDVSLEQVLLWNLDFIIAPKESEDSKNSFFENVYKNKDWKYINMIKEVKNFYEMFYHCNNLTDDDYREILNSVNK